MKFKTLEQKRLTIHITARLEQLYLASCNRQDRRANNNYSTALQLLKKLRDQTKPDVLEYNLTRPELRMLQGQLTSVRRVLLEHSIPTYMKRIDDLDTQELSDSDKLAYKQKYTEYINKNQQRAKLCAEVLDILNN